MCVAGFGRTGGSGSGEWSLCLRSPRSMVEEERTVLGWRGAGRIYERVYMGG